MDRKLQQKLKKLFSKTIDNKQQEPYESDELQKQIDKLMTEDLEYYKSSMMTPVNTPSPGQLTNSSIGSITTGTASVGTISNINVTTSGNTSGTGYTYTIPSTNLSGMYSYSPPQPTIITSFSSNGKEIVRLNKDGSVTWNDDINIDEAAGAFSKTLSLGAEIAAGITKNIKLKMRDSVFEDLIAIAKEKGSLTADDLTYLLSASKIVEKLKGGKE